MPPPSQTTGVLHHIPPFTAFEPSVQANPTNIILWIGGLFDTYHSTRYPYTLSSSLPPSWSLAQLLLSSSGLQWGVGSLDKDVAEISKAVAYFRNLRPHGKIIIMGHSTGCQDAIHYVTSVAPQGQQRAEIDGFILQAPVSDREAMLSFMPREKYDAANKLAQEYMDKGKGEDVLPAASTDFGSCPVSARRWLSLASPDGKGQDDYFSSDLPDESLKASFGKITPKTPLLILFGEKDESVPAHVDKEAMVKRWVKIAEDAGGKVDPQSTELLAGASHNLNKDPESVARALCSRVNKFLDLVEKHSTKL
ncbi:hypothetical protein MBLNU457_3936t2 [Dothideomycetes sp. NU457]